MRVDCGAVRNGSELLVLSGEPHCAEIASSVTDCEKLLRVVASPGATPALRLMYSLR